MSFLKDMAAFMLARKKFWLVPALVLMTIFGGLIVLTKGSVVAPFIYTVSILTSIASRSVSRRSITTALPRSCATARSSRPRRKSASRARSMTRIFPCNALRYCVKEAGVAWRDIDFVTFYEKPFLKFERLLETYLAFAPRGFGSFRMAMPLWLKEKLFQKSLLIDLLRAEAPDIDWDKKLRFTEHHESHAASAFYPSPFSEAAILTMDGVGEWATTSMGVGSGNQLSLNEEIHFPHSLGLLYSAFTYYTGFKVNSGEYKVMGLAPYGEPKYAQAILDNLIDVQADGSFRMNMDYFDYCTGLRMTNDKFDALFGGPPRKPEELLTQREMDLAASIQAVTEEIVLRLTRALAAKTGQKNLCLAGGVALNCVANGKVLRDGKFDGSGSSRRRAMRAGRSARRSRPTTLRPARRARTAATTRCAGRTSGRRTPTRISQLGSDQSALGSMF